MKQVALVQPSSDDYERAFSANIAHLRTVLVKQGWLTPAQTKRLSDGQVKAFVRLSSSFPATKRHAVYQALMNFLD